MDCRSEGEVETTAKAAAGATVAATEAVASAKAKVVEITEVSDDDEPTAAPAAGVQLQSRKPASKKVTKRVGAKRKLGKRCLKGAPKKVSATVASAPEGSAESTADGHKGRYRSADAVAGHSMADKEVFAEFEAATDAEWRQYPDMLASFHKWAQEGKAAKSSGNYVQNVKNFMIKHRKGLAAMTSQTLYVKVLTSKENARCNGVHSASLKKFALWLEQRGSSEGPWEVRAQTGQALYNLSICSSRVSGKGANAKTKAAMASGKQLEGGKSGPGRKPGGAGVAKQTKKQKVAGSGNDASAEPAAPASGLQSFLSGKRLVPTVPICVDEVAEVPKPAMQGLPVAGPARVGLFARPAAVPSLLTPAAKAAGQESQASKKGLVGLFARKSHAFADTTNLDDDEDVVMQSKPATPSAPSPPLRQTTAPQQETPQKPASTWPESTPQKSPAAGQRQFSELIPALQYELDRMRQSVNAAVRAKDFGEANSRMVLLKKRCEQLGCTLPPRQREKPEKEKEQSKDKAKEKGEPTEAAAQGDHAEDGVENDQEPSDRLGFARGILREKFPLVHPKEDAEEDDSEVMLADGQRGPGVGCVERRGRRQEEAGGEGEDEGGEERERAQRMKEALAKIEDAPYHDLERFPAAAETFRRFLREAEGQDEAAAESAVKTLHELFAQDEKSLKAMALQPYLEAVSGDPQHTQVVGLFSKFWRSHEGPLEPAPVRAERGLEVRTRAMHGIPLCWGVRVVQRTRKEDLVILTSPQGISRFAVASQLANLPILQSPEFVAERARREGMTAAEQQAEARQARGQDQDFRQEETRKMERKLERQRAELEEGLRSMISGTASTESRRQVLSVLFRQQVACSSCGRAGREAEYDFDDLASEDTAAAEAAVERAKWTSYEDVPNATEEEIATYPAVLATFFQRGYPYLTGVRKLMELYRKKPLDMATPEFQRLVRHDPENASCNGFLNSAILYLRKFREDGGFDDLVDTSTLDPHKVQSAFTPDFSRSSGKAQDAFDDLQVEVPLECLMADATRDWTQELQEKLDDENYIQEDVDASGHRPVALSIALLPDATDEEWAMWPRILAKYEAAMKQESEEVKAVKREAEAAELLSMLKDLIDSHGKSPSAMASRKYVKMIRASYNSSRSNYDRAVARFSDFWEANKDKEFPEPKVHSLAANKYRVQERRLVEEAKRLASEWKLPEGWAVRLSREGQVMRITGPAKGEVFRDREAALEAVAAKSRKQAEEAKALQQRIISRQEARLSQRDSQNLLQQRIKDAIESEDYELAERLQQEFISCAAAASAEGSAMDDAYRPCKQGTMPIVPRDLKAMTGKGFKDQAKGGKRSLFGKRKTGQEDINNTPLKVRKAQGLKQVQQQQAAALELTLRALEWRVLGVRMNGSAVMPLNSEQLMRTPPEKAVVVLAYVDEEVRDRKKMRIIESWGLDETWSVSIRVRRSGDQITARRSDGKVFFHKHELVCERQRILRQEMRGNAAECLKNLASFLPSAHTQPVWELEAKSTPKLSGLYVRAGDGRFDKVLGAATVSSSHITARMRGKAWEFVEGEGSQVIARTAEGALEMPFAATRLCATADDGTEIIGQDFEVRGALLDKEDIEPRLSSLLAHPRGAVCRFCDASRDQNCCQNKDRVAAKLGITRAERLAQYEARLHQLQARRDAAPHTLPDMVGHMLSKLIRFEGGQLPQALLRRKNFRIGTMCSGTDAPILVSRALQRSLGNYASEWSFEHVFSAEQDLHKQEFIHANFPECPLLFQDVCQMGRKRAYDALSRRPQPVPGELDLLVAGFSCKDLSMMNSYRKTLAEMGTSGSTLRGVLEYVERYRPRIVLLENVWAIAKANGLGFRQVDLVMEGLKARGYAAGYKLLNSCDYYIPQIRHRVWMWGIRIDSAPTGPGSEAEAAACGERVTRSVHDKFNSILSELEEPCALHFDDYMLDDDHPDVRAHIELMASKNRQSVKKARGGAKRDWTQKYGNHRSGHDYQYERPYTAVRDAEFLHVLNEREKELLDLKCLDVLNEQGKDPRTHSMLWELSQSVERVPGTRVRPDRQNYATCILPGMLWHSSRHRWVLGVEKLALQGVFAEDLRDTNFSQKLLGDLAGNAFTTTVCAANLIAAIVCADDITPSSS